MSNRTLAAWSVSSVAQWGQAWSSKFADKLVGAMTTGAMTTSDPRKSVPAGIDFELGGYTLRLPRRHALPRHRRRWPLYQEPIRIIATAMQHVKTSLCALDIGANVGDTACMLVAAGISDILCIEGDPEYLPYLCHNARALGSAAIVEPCFVGTGPGAIDHASLQRAGGTTRITQLLDGACGTGTGIPLQRLEAITEKHSRFSWPDLIKIDTDGHDCEILAGHSEWIDRTQPVLFLEYAPSPEAARSGESLTCLLDLLDRGYVSYLIFDNFGHFLMSTSSGQTLRDLELFLEQNRVSGTAVHYFDICAIPGRFAEVEGHVRRALEPK